MATTSTVPTVRARLVTLLQAALPGVLVTPSHPGDAYRSECVFLGEVRGDHEVPVMRAGRAKRHETYTIDVYMEAAEPGNSATDAETRAFELFAALEDVVANDLSLNQSQPFWATIGHWEEGLSPDDMSRGWACIIRAEVNVNVRLS